MPFYKRTYSPGQLQFITTSTYRRAPLFLSERFCGCFVQRIEEVRQELKLLLLGWVLMPDHFNVFNEKKRREKLNYMHNNPVKRGLVSAPGIGCGRVGGFISCRMHRSSAWTDCNEPPAPTGPFGKSQTPQDRGLRQPGLRPLLRLRLV
jgi:hypothetical protein